MDFKPTSTSLTVPSNNGEAGYTYSIYSSGGVIEHKFLVEVGHHICGPLLELVVDRDDTAHLEKAN